MDKLTVQARFSVALARKAGYAELERVVGALVMKAQDGNVQAAKLLLDYVRVLVGAEDDECIDITRPEDMTPAQRDALRAQLLREIAASREDAANEEDRREGKARPMPCRPRPTPTPLSDEPLRAESRPWAPHSERRGG